jgi:hypothetical protein
VSDEQISNEEAFARALDLNPDVIVKGSITISMKAQHAVVGFQVVVPVDYPRLAAAMMAGQLEEPKPEPAKTPPRKRAPAKKAAAKKS